MEFSALQVPCASDLGPLDRANTLNPDTKTTHCAMTNHSKLHPGEFSRDIAKWHRGVIADIKQLTRGITRGNQVYLPQIVLSPRPRRVIRVTACQAPENMRMKDDSYVCWKDSSGTLVASQKVNWRPNRTRSSSRTASTGSAPETAQDRTPGTPNSVLEEHGILTHNLIVAAVLIFDTADAALNWRRWEKQRRKAEQQAREQGRRKRIKRGLVL